MHDGTVFYTASEPEGRYLYARDAPSGALRWRTISRLSDSPIVFSNRVWTSGSNQGRSLLEGYDSADGTRQFSTETQNLSRDPAALYEGVLYTYEKGIFRARDARLGTLQWTINTNLSTQTYFLSGSMPAVHNGRAVVVGENNTLITFDLATRRVLWRRTGSYRPSPVIDGDTVYVLKDGALVAYDAETGGEKGQYVRAFDPSANYAEVSSQPIITDDLVVFSSIGSTFVFNKASYQLIATLPTGGFLSYAKGVLYVASVSGILSTYRFEGSTEPASPPGPGPTPFPSRTSAVRGKVDLVSVNQAGTSSVNGVSSINALSRADGRYVLFSSNGTDVTTLADQNGIFDLFVRDLHTGNVRMVTTDHTGTAAAPRGVAVASETANITPDGRFVFFADVRSGFIQGIDQNTLVDLYRRDMQTDQIELISVGRDGKAAGGNRLFFTPDGRFALFSSVSTEIIRPDLNGAATDVFLRDLHTNTTSLVSFDKSVLGEDGMQAAGLTPDGRFALMQGNSRPDGALYLCDLQTRTTTLASPTIQGWAPSERVLSPRVSDDGRFVLFQSEDQNFVANDANRSLEDVFLRDMQTQTTTRINTPDNKTASLLDASSDLRYIAFQADWRAREMFLYDRVTGRTEQILTGKIDALEMDRTGRFILFRSEDKHFVDGASGTLHDIFLLDRV